ncbi:DUF4825 domain-containing protein [Paenibacillus sp. FSL M8-0334]|uniref:DUF4825 domain-containing protein n=1 Tax=Paenibacillus sp. FSL M8-0334 TaxID=2921623 RepID=UPI0030FBFBD7
MRRTGVWIVVLLVVGMIGLAVMEGYVKPKLDRQAKQYEMDQNDPLTHHIEPTVAYASPYMGDAGNLINLNASLPFRNIGRTFQLYPEVLTAEIRYQTAAGDTEPHKLKEILLYNATANFVMIDNLEKLKFVFEDETVFVADRELVESWYGEEGSLSVLRDAEVWEEQVRDRLRDADYVRNFAERVLHLEEFQAANGQ